MEPQRLEKMPERNPVNGTFELTIRCNLHCKMCMFRHDDSENAEIMEKELTADQWIDMARQAAEAGTMSLLITGGEPMLRPDFCEIWEGIYKQGFIMELYTNATLVTPKVMETLKKYPPHRIGVTIYGASPETYGKVCGNEGAFEKMLDGVHRLQLLPSILEFRTTLIKDNFSDSTGIDKMVNHEFGVQYNVKQACPINKAVRGASADVESCRIPPELDMEMKTRRVIERARKIIGDRFKLENLIVTRKNNTTVQATGEEKTVTFFGCQAGISQYTITYYGNLLACQMIGAFELNVLGDGLKAAWERFPYEVHIPNTEVSCEGCEYVETCQSCYGSRYAETGDFNGCSDYIFRTAKSRKQYESFLGGISDGKYQI
ncbi:MAG: radical SAM protein [Coprococcus sp.]